MKPSPACHGAVPIEAISTLSVIVADGADIEVSDRSGHLDGASWPIDEDRKRWRYAGENPKRKRNRKDSAIHTLDM